MALPTSKKTWSEGMSTEKEITMILWKVWVLLRAWNLLKHTQKSSLFLKSLRYFQCKYKSALLQLSYLTTLNILKKILWKIFFQISHV